MMSVYPASNLCLKVWDEGGSEETPRVDKAEILAGYGDPR